MSMLRVFKATMPSVSVIFGDGTQAIFVGGVYRTDNESHIATLESEIKKCHPHLFIDPAEKEIDSTMVDPMAQLRAKIIAEYLAAEANATDPTNDMGTTEQTKLKPANTVDIAQAAANGSGAQLSAQLTNLMAKVK